MLAVTIEPRTSAPPLPLDPRWHDLARSSPAAQSLALLDALARDVSGRVDYPAHVASTVAVHVVCDALAGRAAIPNSQIG
jgi:hypothetical protein